MTKFSDSELNSHYHDALLHGVFRGVSDRAIGPGKRHDIRLSDDGVYTRIVDADQQSWFKTQNGRPHFNVFTAITAADAAETIARLVRNQVSMASSRKGFVDTFGKYSVKATTHEIYGGDRSGVLVRVPVLEIPEGDGGGLGGRLFSQAYNAFARPGLVARWGEMPGGDLTYRVLRNWIDFSAPGISGRF